MCSLLDLNSSLKLHSVTVDSNTSMLISDFLKNYSLHKIHKRLLTQKDSLWRLRIIKIEEIKKKGTKKFIVQSYILKGLFVNSHKYSLKPCASFKKTSDSLLFAKVKLFLESLLKSVSFESCLHFFPFAFT